jgi:hypothetical protein
MDRIAATQLVESVAALAFWGLATCVVGAGECEVTLQAAAIRDRECGTAG